MQNLRDQLLKTGLISKGQKQQVEQDKRRERKQLKKGQADDIAQEQQRRAYEARLEAQRAADRERPRRSGLSSKRKRSSSGYAILLTTGSLMSLPGHAGGIL
jgi:hypothetical protein